jgi:CDP-glucose 4,6-dehydratase
MGSDLSPIVQNQASNEIQHQFLDATKAKEVLGWTPDFTLNRGLEKTISWYHNFLNTSKVIPQLEYSEIETLPLSNLAIQQIVHN